MSAGELHFGKSINECFVKGEKMKPHKHAELIKAWADGAEIQFRDNLNDWTDCGEDPDWNEQEGECEFRIKTEPNPDDVWIHRATFTGGVYPNLEKGNLKLTFDGETGELKSAEVLK